ncbi:hypothetical protein CHU32_26195 [Superficieibacter electus]|uniref:Aminopeptidase n=1 Tax=Superficieibacter electus TaxID=2022662 RepID=A0A2P5GHB3_9ENTR|nr:hypothetical protein [Superficieibacter electus]POP40632.1 hypothetical protein CHU33_26350 [Superficieibacter electus]POP41684.1 hypothetical protein CHU32_26195 [Superficieibacter electus]
MNNKLLLLLFLSSILLTGCSKSSSIDARKTGAASHRAETSSSLQLTDQDVFGNELTLEISEGDIQNAVEEAKGDFEISLNSSVILVQSGERAPDVVMQKEMQKYYKVSTFSGIPVVPKKQPVRPATIVKDAESVTDTIENLANNGSGVINANYMQALRYIGAKGRQKAVIVYWGELESGKYNSTTKDMVWKKYSGGNLSGLSLRYLIRFALVDVATGEWATYSPVNTESATELSIGKKEGSADMTMTEQQILNLKQKSYQIAVDDLVSRYGNKI